MSGDISPATATLAAATLNMIAARLIADATTLAKLSSQLLMNDEHGRTIGQLRRYADHFEQSAADDVRKVVAALDDSLPPDYVKCRRADRERDKRKASAEVIPPAWPPEARPVTENVVTIDFGRRS